MRIDKPASQYDLVVVGGGLVGASFTAGLSRICGGSLSILVVEAVAADLTPDLQPSFDARCTAISFGSSQIFDRIGIWKDVQATAAAIEEIQVSDRGHLGSANIRSSEFNYPALGYVVENRKLGQVLNSSLSESKDVDLLSPARITRLKPTPKGMQLQLEFDDTESEVDCSLVVLSDGGRSPICSQLGITQKKKSYEQCGIIANIAFEKAHKNIAFERFTESGPLAVLPLPELDGENRASLVWTVHQNEANEFAELSDVELLDRLQDRFGNRLGKITHIGERTVYPLSLSVAAEQARPGIVLLGNVAHNLHPVAGQGLNLALRDAEALIAQIHQSLISEGKDSIGTMSCLQKYIEGQSKDQDQIILFTDQVTKLFSNSNSAMSLLRKFGLLTIDLIPSLRRAFSEQAMGL